MGLLTQIIQERHQKDQMESAAKLDAYRSVISSPDSTPEGKQYALDQLLQTAKIGGKDRGPVAQMFGHLLGIGHNKQQPGQQAQQAPPPAPAPGPSDAPTSGGGPLVQRNQPSQPAAPQPQQQPQQPAVAPMPTRFFKTSKEIQDEALDYEQKRQGILLQQKQQLQQEAEEAKQNLELAKEKARLNARKITTRGVPATELDPQSNPWDYYDVTYLGDGTKSQVPTKRPAAVEKTYQEAKSYAETHPDVSLKQAYGMIWNGDVDMRSLRKKNVESEIANRAEIRARRAATPIGGAKKGTAATRKESLEALESKELAAAGGDAAQALKNVKGHADKAKEFYGNLYGPLINSLRIQAGKSGLGDEFAAALGGKGTGGSAPKQSGPKKDDTKNYNGYSYKFNGKIWVRQSKVT